MGEISKINMGGVDYDIRDKVLEEQLGNINANPMISVTYAELVALRDNGELIAGMQYRITDFVTTTAQENTRSAGHQFDVIVTADNENTLNEVARACRSEFDIEKYKDAYSSTLGENVSYIGLYQYEGKEYHLYESIDTSNKVQMLVDFYRVDKLYEEGTIEYPYCIYPHYAKFIEAVDWENGYDFGENICFKLNPIVTYFKDSNLAAWQIWYSLDNDAERFAWADTANGKGVIYRMIDEWNNDCPYDFKNIQFKRLAVTEYDKVPSLVVDNEDNNYGYYYGALTLFGDQAIQEATYGEDFVWVYTFALKDLATETWHDYTILNSIGLKTDESVIITCHSNVIKEHRDEYLGEHGRKAIWLNNIVFFNCYADISSSDYSDYYSYCYSNSFGNNCNSNSFGNDCYYNSFGNNCYSNSFGNNCYYNSFGNNCYNVELSESTNYKTASVNPNNKVKVFNLADLADFLNS